MSPLIFILMLISVDLPLPPMRLFGTIRCRSEGATFPCERGENGAVDDEEVALTHCHILLFRWKGAPAGGRGQCCIGVRVDWCTKPMTRVANGSGALYHN